MSNQFEAFTEEQDEWIIEHYNDMPLTKLLVLFNERFNSKRTYAVLKQRCRKTLHLTHYTFGEQRVWSDEYDEWLKMNIDSHSRKGLTDAFNKCFGTHMSEDSIKVRCNKILGLRFSDNKERLSKLHSDGHAPIGNVIVTKQGYCLIKGEDRKYHPAGKYLYEQANGKIPKGAQIVFLDGDRTNLSLDNIYCVSGKVERELNKKRWRFNDPEMTLTAIKVCELFYLLKEIKAGTIISD